MAPDCVRSMRYEILSSVAAQAEGSRPEMKAFSSLILPLLVLVAACSEQTSSLRYVTSDGHTFKVKAPVEWIKDDSGHMLTISSPEHRAVLLANVYVKEDTSFKDFADARYALIPDYFDETTGRYRVQDTIVKEYQGVSPHSGNQIYHAVSVKQIEDQFATVSIMTSENDYQKNRSLYEEIFQSVTLIK